MSDDEKDRARLNTLLGSLDASPVTLKRDWVRGEGRTGHWSIRGRLGHIYRDGVGFLLCVVAEDERKQSARRWGFAKGRLAVFCRLSQDGVPVNIDESMPLCGVN